MAVKWFNFNNKGHASTQLKIGEIMKNSKSAVMESYRDSKKIEVVIQEGKAKTYSTKNTLGEKVRIQMESILQDRLADSIDLPVSYTHLGGSAFTAHYKSISNIFWNLGHTHDGISVRPYCCWDIKLLRFCISM